MRLIVILGIISAFFFLCVFLVLLAVKISLAGELETQKNIFASEEKKFQTAEIKDFQKNIAYFNRVFTEINSFYDQQVNLSLIFDDLSEILPPNIYLTRFFWQKEIGQVNLSGFSPLREKLFELKSNLENEERFEGVSFPPANWVKPKDIDFQATFKIKPQK